MLTYLDLSAMSTAASVHLPDGLGTSMSSNLIRMEFAEVLPSLTAWIFQVHLMLAVFEPG